METNGARPQISAQEAAASLAAVADSHRRARRAGYPVWFWLASGLSVAALPLYIVKSWLPAPWAGLIPFLATILIAGTTIALSLGALRGVRGCPTAPGAALRELLPFLWAFVPYTAVLLAGGIAWRNGYWHEPIAPLVTATAAFAVWTGFGMAATTFSAFRR